MDGSHSSSASAPWQNSDLSEQVRVIEVDPCVADLAVPHFHDRTAVIARLTPGGRNIDQWAEVGSARAPPDDHMAVASGKDLLNIEVEVGERSHIDLEELTGAFVSGERCWEGIRFPRGLRVEPFKEGFDIVRVPSSKHLSSYVEVVLSSHGVLLRLDGLK
jgi:hypothetical protein